MEEIELYLDGIGRNVSFIGKHCGHIHPIAMTEHPNWHYYLTDKGEVIHVRKEKMICVVSRRMKDDGNNS